MGMHTHVRNVLRSCVAYGSVNCTLSRPKYIFKSQGVIVKWYSILAKDKDYYIFYSIFASTTPSYKQHRDFRDVYKSRYAVVTFFSSRRVKL